MDKGRETLYITEYVDVDTLQKIQNAFSNMTGMAAITVDFEGQPVTKGTNYSELCSKHIRRSAVGRYRCEQCDRYGIEETHSCGQVSCYRCHAGLLEFAAPIVVEGKVIGGIVGGQVAARGTTEKSIAALAKELDIPEEMAVAAFNKINATPLAQVEKAAHFLQDIAAIISDMAYGRYLALQANDDIEHAANMKADFLANMSHEIRTPMNAVIGMAEMALREDLTDSAREFIGQIKSSGKVLLSVINDILDFSKIQSGKMDIIPVDYESMSIINDVANILNPRLSEKKVELIVDVDPYIPYMLEGDNIRIKQALQNLASNAVKFTNEGQVKLRLGCSYLEGSRVMVNYTVSDSGIGIREEDINNLFGSFSQLDSKRNRNIEGTGLGLAITKQLVELMGGTMEVKSEYGKGSTFSFSIPQRIADVQKSISIKDKDKIKAYGFFNNIYVAQQFEADGKALGMDFRILEDKSELLSLDGDEFTFLFVEKSRVDLELEEYLKNQNRITIVLLYDYADSTEVFGNSVISIKKPLYVLNESLIFNHEDRVLDLDSENAAIDFTAPEARILIVDDNAINLTVAEGLLDPLDMKITTALSGREAIKKIQEYNGFDIVFMDHMMPELDGIETTRLIRSELTQFADMPIIALTANASAGAKELFVSAGMTDFVAKPIEVRSLIQKIRAYLPHELIVKGKKKAVTEDNTDEGSLVVGDLDTASALKLLGNETLFWKVLKDYYSVIEKKAEAIRKYETMEDWPAYTIEVHALKSASRQIGANSLADQAMALEQAGNEKNAQLIHSATEGMLTKYLTYIPLLAPFCEDDSAGNEDNKPEIDTGSLLELLDKMQEAFDCLDMDEMELVYNEMNSYSYETQQKELLARLKEAVDSLDMDAGEEVIALFRESC